MKEEILRIEKLAVSFSQYEGRTVQKTELPVITGLDLTVRKGELVAVVGSSGSGKSLLAHAILGLLPKNAKTDGTIYYHGARQGKAELAQLRGEKIALVPQSVGALDPRMKTGAQLLKGKKDQKRKRRMEELFERYGLEKETAKLYPFELSGGMARRVLLLTALMENPELIIADEPTPGMELALAVTAAEDFRRFADGGGGVLFITHDLELARRVADRIVVFYAGMTVEDMPASDFFAEERLRHPYSKALFGALPENGFEPWPGTQPYVKDLPKGCPFAPRCLYRKDACGGEIPFREEHGGFVRCVGGARG